jgi:chromosome partitioning protein
MGDGPRVLSVLSVKGGTGKTTLAVNLAGWLARERAASVALLDGDRNKGAQIYASRTGGQSLPFPVFPLSRYRSALAAASDLLIVDGQASPDLSELQEIATDSDRVLVPTSAARVSLLLCCEVAEVLRASGVDFRVVLTRCDARQARAIESAEEFLQSENLPLLRGRTSQLAAYEQAEAVGCLVGDATTDRGTRNPRSADAWAEITSIATEIFDGLL